MNLTKRIWILFGLSAFSTMVYIFLGQYHLQKQQAEILQLAGKGDAEGQYRMGMSILQHFRKEDEPGQAVTLLRNAAHQGHLKAQFELGRYHLYVSHDFMEAWTWLSLAAEQNHPNATKLRDESATFLKPEEVPATQTRLDEVRKTIQKP